MLSRFVVWPALSGTVFLAAGLVAVRRQFLVASRLDRVIVLGPVFVAAPLALFGAEHVVAAQFVMQAVPAWMPARLFWAYFVGTALLATATSFVLMKQVRASSTLFGIMLLLFVLLMHLPNAASNTTDPFAWTVAVRDLAFGGGAWALAGTQTKEWRLHGTSRLITFGRVIMAVAVVFFGVEHTLHPEFAPGVPLRKLTPPWIPAPLLWGYLTGAVLVIVGACLLVTRHARAAAAWLGIIMALLTLFIYLPMLSMTAQSSEIVEGLNYVADTLLFGGTALLLAGALPKT